MRDIKFNIWDKESSKMIEWDDRKTYPWFMNVIDFNKYNSEDYAILQFTGLLDKNGKEIYEGDIVRMEKELVTGKTDHRYKREKWSRSIKDEAILINKVIFKDGKFTTENLHHKILTKKYRHKKCDINSYSLIIDVNKNMEVIGNIYEPLWNEEEFNEDMKDFIK